MAAATVFGYYVNDPERFGVVEFDKDGHATSIEEKPASTPRATTRSRACTSTTSDVVEMAKQVKPSARGELEITDAEPDAISTRASWTSSCWAAATPGSTPARWTPSSRRLTFVQTVEQRQGIKISAPEEIAYKYGWITKEKLLESAAALRKIPLRPASEECRRRQAAILIE